jgi:protease-4
MLASDVIWREIKITAEQGKPVIASMGNYAASGGYYLAMACDKIVAQPTTVTGSIGVVIMRWDFAGLYRDLPLNVEIVKTSPSADFYDTSRALSTEELDGLRIRTERIYRDFVQKAADSRGLDFQAMEKVARGRVWSGLDAVEKNLVDEFGSLNHAIALAAEEAGLENYQVIRYPLQNDYWSLFSPGSLPSARQKQAHALRQWVPYDIRFLGDLLEGPTGSRPFAISPYLVHLD